MGRIYVEVVKLLCIYSGVLTFRFVWSKKSALFYSFSLCTAEQV